MLDGYYWTIYEGDLKIVQKEDNNYMIPGSDRLYEEQDFDIIYIHNNLFENNSLKPQV